ncbi:EcsC family protein [Metabacillus sp. KIGAM252]|uniref:EcsC family protein n=1 Tax=Metabacillus flavus TaxID=2823519 RepID=A0ABS5LC13_9BACI|nr:EcsC family protein [Metabacillus flavus]MBS2968263.1 EcsC family protein [Metabacillus flavus]
MSYEKEVLEEVLLWKKRFSKRPAKWQRKSKDIQAFMTDRIPGKVHDALTESIRLMTEMTIKGSQWTNMAVTDLETLKEKDVAVRSLLSTYKKAAALEGAATGAGGFAAGMADFPLLLGIKMKFLFETAGIYGFSPKSLQERVYILMIFQLAFSSEPVKGKTLSILEQWETQPLPIGDMNWREFQQEYRDHIDLVKMLQLVPGIGAAVGGTVNYRLLDKLGETAMKVYQMRILTNGDFD